MFDLHIIKKEQQQTSSWAGGTTTQIAIYPQASVYGNRDFIWRLSTAVVELEESIFTKMSGFNRLLMVLEGRLKLVHKHQHIAMLKQFEQDSFKGDWETVSFGRARDFNLMLKEGTKGRLEHMNVPVGKRLEIMLEEKNQKLCFFACYCFEGEASISVREQDKALSGGDLLLINYNESLSLILENNGDDECNLIAAYIEL